MYGTVNNKGISTEGEFQLRIWEFQLRIFKSYDEKEAKLHHASWEAGVLNTVIVLKMCEKTQ